MQLHHVAPQFGICCLGLAAQNILTSLTMWNFTLQAILVLEERVCVCVFLCGGRVCSVCVCMCVCVSLWVVCSYVCVFVCVCVCVCVCVFVLNACVYLRHADSVCVCGACMCDRVWSVYMCDSVCVCTCMTVWIRMRSYSCDYVCVCHCTYFTQT